MSTQVRQSLIFIYRTNVQNVDDRERLRPWFDGHSHITDWSVDVEDCDKVLRVVCRTELLSEIAAAVREHGFLCEELN